jgi:hypothetical protein
MTKGEYHSRLYYRDTQIEVQLGDVVRIKRWFRNDLEGVVCYLPGISPKHPEMEYEDVQQWGIRGADGSVIVACYAPEQLQPKRNIVFVRRGDSRGLMPDAELL